MDRKAGWIDIRPEKWAGWH